MLAPLLGFREPREFVLPLLNDRVIPIPGLPGYGLEFRFGERDVMVGAHLDLGTLILPQSWGFGPATFAPIGGPPAPVSRKADGEAGSSAPHAAAQIESSRGEGRALPEAVRAPLETKLASNFEDVRIHDDVPADRLSRSLKARAFTSGADIFFRAGEYDPHSPSGSRLLAHELVHTVQQARGEVAGESTPAGLRVSPANDAHEIEAERAANAVIRY
jgi:hypothetical protein